jgi:hypothetical protein
MPATSEKQKKFMDAVAHNKAFATQAGVPQSVGKEFSESSKGLKFGKGASTRADLQRINKPKTLHGKMSLFKKGGETMATKKNPNMMAMAAKKMMAPSAPRAPVAPASPMGMGMKKGGMKKMASGGMTGSALDVGNSTKMGKVRTEMGNINGVAIRGKTKGKQVVMSGNKGMRKGGMAC